MWSFFVWWFTLLFLGLIIFPFVHKIFNNFPNHGYAFSKTIAIIIAAYFYWLFVSYGLLPNTQESSFAIIMLMVIASLIFILNNKDTSPFKWIQVNWKHVFFSEMIFLLSFAFWAFIRATNPQIVGTEKPMELAFINAILRSPVFPPADPWLSGYSISYYYFGYIIIAWLSYITGTTSSVAYNLAIAMVFALTASNAQSILFALLSQKQLKIDGSRKKNSGLRKYALSLLAPIFILIVSNSEGLLEILHNQGVFWNQTTKQSTVWSLIDIKELNQAPNPPYLLEPEISGRTWWWRASRVLEDETALGESREIINEFPFFSFWLADLHPHVLAIPVILVLIALGLVVFWTKHENHGNSLYLRVLYANPIFWAIIFTFGIIAFTNMWDLPVCLLFIFGTLLFNQGTKRIRFAEIKRSLVFVLLSVINGVILVLPFFLGFASQAGGVLPSMLFFTKSSHFLVMFIPLLVPIFSFYWTHRSSKVGYFISIGLVSFSLVIGFVCMYLFALVISGGLKLLMGNLPLFEKIIGISNNQITQAVTAFLNIYQVQSLSELLSRTLYSRLSDVGTLLILGILGMLTISRFIDLILHKNSGRVEKSGVGEIVFIFHLLTFAGFITVVFPEFFYLRDVFGWRMNTIFKFYYQAWIFWGLAASFATASLFLNSNQKNGHLMKIFVALSIFSGLVYPIFAFRERANNISFEHLTLDGNAFLSKYQPDVFAASKTLTEYPYGNLLEAIGGSYTSFARYATLTGYPNLLGWPGHEMQWRGGVKEIGTREVDAQTIYETSDWETALSLLSKYHIRYIIIGDLEHSRYAIEETKFLRNSSQIFTSPQVNVYAIY